MSQCIVPVWSLILELQETVLKFFDYLTLKDS